MAKIFVYCNGYDTIRFMISMKQILFLILVLTVVSLPAEAKMNVIQLQKSIATSSTRLHDAIQKRRSVRNFSAKPLNVKQISSLLWAAQGITEARRGLRAAPSAGALYPLELYVVKADGIWHYLVRQHALEQIGTDDVRTSLSAAALSQREIALAPVDIVIAANYARTTGKYGERGRRYVHIEVGHAAQNILLEVQALGLAAVTIGAFNDQAVHGVLHLPDNQVALYIIPIGYAKR